MPPPSSPPSDASPPRRPPRSPGSDASPPRRPARTPSSDASPPRRPSSSPPHHPSLRHPSPSPRPYHSPQPPPLSSRDASPPRRRKPAVRSRFQPAPAPPPPDDPDSDASPPRRPRASSSNVTPTSPAPTPQRTGIVPGSQGVVQSAPSFAWQSRPIRQATPLSNGRQMLPPRWPRSRGGARGAASASVQSAVRFDSDGERPRKMVRRSRFDEAVGDRTRVRGHVEWNRFGMQPGPRWDGVQRGNGFERRLEGMRVQKREGDRLAYQESVADL